MAQCSESMTEDDSAPELPPIVQEGTQIFNNFCIMSCLFSINHGTVVACLSLATARLGMIGAWQSGILYLCYTLSAVLGASLVVTKCGARNGMILGMLLYSIYVASFLIVELFPSSQQEIALIGAMFGGVGSGLLWLAQGAYFTDVSKRYAYSTAKDLSDCNSYLAGTFAFIYLSFETFVHALSSALTMIMDWTSIFATFTVITLVTATSMVYVYDYSSREREDLTSNMVFHLTAAVRLIIRDPKMKYMIGLNATFGFSGAFVNSYVNGEVARQALNDKDSHFIGLFSAWTTLVAATTSILTSRISTKGPMLIIGAFCFFFVSFPFLIQPNAKLWGLSGLMMIYSLQGIGRSTFESTLKATFADYFDSDPIGAFSNIVLQNGLASSLGYALTFSLICNVPSRYCVEFSDGSRHDVRKFVLIICCSALLSILGFWMASTLRQREIARRDMLSTIEADLELT